ncbi:putative Fe-S oxidoreductase [Sphaerochaeta pleomorpha str. Grapes]|uniref:Putative Fe-S oxidoreductase n=1 Tax=Sphaerochaeta pleomorpha (strain ATCC BAA-1885 / DSM 22778 / Grapes) TaxID=158190 RepID=G8QXR4_SPHPG|nr:YkgJ family cysteine cluster protein [Sphaerochaeta pleomorpha]AEV30708.1 putative Fe-S oxidoreductase [Sphaerochaeta pleomorpha str. Grapes]
MNSLSFLCDTFLGTYAEESFKSLVELYATIEHDTQLFCFENSIACGPGCGTCCEHFIPDITNAEARLVAAYLLFVKNDQTLLDKLENFDQNSEGPCPLYDFGNAHHCTVYEVRPLICRLFGACASQDKNGSAVFRRCRYNTEGTMPMLLHFTNEVPVMQDFAYAIRSLDMDQVGARLLPEAVTEMAEQLKFLRSMLGFQNDNPDDTPNPIAS